MLNEKYDYDYEHAIGMKKIIDLKYSLTNEETLYNGIQAFRNELTNQYNRIMEFTTGVDIEIITPLKQFLNEQLKMG